MGCSGTYSPAPLSRELESLKSRCHRELELVLLQQPTYSYSSPVLYEACGTRRRCFARSVMARYTGMSSAFMQKFIREDIIWISADIISKGVMNEDVRWPPCDVL
jgi:hypothetical protein